MSAESDIIDNRRVTCLIELLLARLARSISNLALLPSGCEGTNREFDRVNTTTQQCKPNLRANSTGKIVRSQRKC